MTDLFSIKGKVALVTGGSRGIGLMIARGFVEAGAKVYISSRKAEACDEVAAELSQATGRASSMPADLRHRGRAARRSPPRSRRASRASHILVNNAGANWGAPLAEYPDAAWDKVLALNVKGVFHLTRACLPLLREGARRPATRRASSTSARSTACRCRCSRPTRTRRARPPCTT